MKWDGFNFNYLVYIDTTHYAFLMGETTDTLTPASEIILSTNANGNFECTLSTLCFDKENKE